MSPADVEGQWGREDAWPDGQASSLPHLEILLPQPVKELVPRPIIIPLTFCKYYLSGMTDRQQRRRQLLDRIDVLLKEAYALPKTRESWERREEIEWEILNLCRSVSDLSTGPLPYWIDTPKPESDPGTEPKE